MSLKLQLIIIIISILYLMFIFANIRKGVLKLKYSLLWLFTGIDQLLEKLPKTIKKVIDFISKLTLEIYLVQSVLIRLISPIGFPWNFIAVTASIIIAAYLLHLICKGFYFLCDKSVKLLKNKWRKE